MFENAINSKKQGDIGMCYAIAYFSKLGYTVNIPITDSQDYDLVIDNDVELLKVQIKTTRFIRHGVYVVALKTCGGNRSGQTIKNFDKNSSDLLFIMTEGGELYLMPKSEVYNKTSLALSGELDKYKVHL